MAKKNYELIEHTADIGIKVKGGDLKDLFKNAARAMFDILAEKKEAKTYPTKNIVIKQKADNREELLVNWLNELLSLSATKGLIFSDFKIKKLDDNNLEAIAKGKSIKGYRVNTEIKAATYCQLSIAPVKSGWQAQIIFDV